MSPCKGRVGISNWAYKSSLTTIYLLRFIGIFPFAIYRDTSGNFYIKRSFLYAIYSCTLGIILHYITYVGLFKDFSLGYSKAVRVHSRTDGYVAFGSYTATQLIVFSGIFIIPRKFSFFNGYINVISQIDSQIRTRNSRWELLKTPLVCYGLFIIMICTVTGDYFAYFAIVGRKVETDKMLRISLGYYICLVMAMITVTQYFYLGNNLITRVKRLNKLLKTLYLFGMEKKQTDLIKCIPWSNVRVNKRVGIRNAVSHIGILMKSYIKLTEAARYQNCLLGATGVVAIIAGYWHLITGSYYFCTELRGNRRNLTYLIMKFTWCILHCVRILLVIEPWYACTMEVENTKSWVCKLRYSNYKYYLNKELRIFQIILGLNPVNFSLAGFTVIKRSLFTSALGTAVTYLVILLQSKAKDDE